MQYTRRDHSFVIPAYGETPYLEECLRSLRAQTVLSGIRITTSTPQEDVRNLSEKYDIPLIINTNGGGMAGDWNFAIQSAETALVTLAHQDDLYEPLYTERMLKKMNESKNPILFCSGYTELRGGRKVGGNTLLNIKKLLCKPMKVAPATTVGKRMSLAFGNGICCPSVTYRREIMLTYPFREGLRADLDWEQWERLSRLDGCFVYDPAPLMAHRIHGGSETSRIIGSSGRSAEDYEMFCRFWPKPIARMLTDLYAYSEKYNSLRS